MMDEKRQAEAWSQELYAELLRIISQLPGDVEIQDLDGNLIILVDTELVDKWISMNMSARFAEVTGIDPAGVFDGDEWVGDYALSRHGTTCADYALASCARYELRVLAKNHRT